jgi:hypothetical protein
LIRQLSSILVLIFTFNVQAEPWLASRFANNCAACHSPGRVDVEPKSRRCTFTCQGCHTNPNGGGLRNSHGKWNQERWLRSRYVPSWRMNKPRPDVTSEQAYAPEKLKDFLAKNTDPKLLKRVTDEGFRLKETPKIYPEHAYAPADDDSFEPDLNKARLSIPAGDPYRVRRENIFNAGLDYRYLYLDKKHSLTPSQSTKATFPMTADVAVSAEPYKRVNLVFESRFSNGPTREGWDEGFTTGAQVKSAYVLIDDLPFNAYVMHGLYRPQIGHYNPDHTSLFGEATGFNQNAYFKTTSVGAAPRVPFFNFHYIQPLGDSSSLTKSQDQGFGVNIGARWSTYGLYVMQSYWKTTADYRSATPTAGVIVDNSIMSTTMGATFARWTGTFDYTIVEKDQQNIRADKGTVLTLENRIRTWRENYALFNYELLNTDTDLLDGDSRQITIGWSSFPISSLELAIMYKQLAEDSKAKGNATIKTTLAQMHFFF